MSSLIILKIYHIDAEGMKLGRLASVIKKTVLFHITTANDRPYKSVPNYLIVVSNCSKILTSPNRIRNKKYFFHSGCPGGLRTLSWGALNLTNPEKVVELALRRMLPTTVNSKNILRKVRFHRHECMGGESLRIIRLR